MFRIPKQQVLERWDEIPQNLREAICSEENANILWRFCESQHLSDDKIFKVAFIVNDVFLGFIHPEDVPVEIKNELGINQEIADAIYKEVDRKIFGPVRDDIKKVYSPVTVSSVAGAPPVSSQNIVDLTSVPTQKFQPLPVPSAPSTPKIVSPGQSELQRLTQVFGTAQIEEKSRVAEAPSPTSPAATHEEPVIIHKHAEITPTPTPPPDKRSLGGLFWFLGKRSKAGSSEVQARVEIEKPKTEAPKVVSTPQSAPKIIHYTELKSPISPFGAPQGQERAPARMSSLGGAPVSIPGSVNTEMGAEVAEPRAPITPKPIPPKPPESISAFRPSAPQAAHPESDQGIRIIKPRVAPPTPPQTTPGLNKNVEPKITHKDFVVEDTSMAVPPAPPKPTPPKPASAQAPQLDLSQVKKPEEKKEININIGPEPIVLKRVGVEETKQEKPKIHDINIFMNMPESYGAPAVSRAEPKEQPRPSFPVVTRGAPVKAVEKEQIKKLEKPPVVSQPSPAGENININISVAPLAPKPKAEHTTEVAETKNEDVSRKPPAPTPMPRPTSANTTENKPNSDTIIDLRTFEIKKRDSL